MKDTISEEDMYFDITKTELEKDISKLKREDKIQKEGLTRLESALKDMLSKYKKLASIVKISDEAVVKSKKVEAEFKKAAKKLMSTGRLDLLSS